RLPRGRHARRGKYPASLQVNRFQRDGPGILGRGRHPAASYAARSFVAVSAISESVSYFLRCQMSLVEKSPSPLFRGTTWICRCGTLWLIRVFVATNEPWAPSAFCTAMEVRRTAPR